MWEVVSSLTGLLSEAVTDEFKKLIQPASMVAAALFLVLSLVAIGPPLTAQPGGAAYTLVRLPTGWQIALATLAFFSLSYVFSSLGGFFLGLVTGHAWKGSPVVGRLMRHVQQRRFEATDRRLEPPTDEVARSRAAAALAKEFPDDPRQLAPTRLGNLLLNAASYAKQQYGVHLDSIWPVMDLVLQEKNADLRARLSSGRDSLTFLASLVFLLGVAAVEIVIVQLAFGEALYTLWALLPVAAAALAYRAAVDKAEVWGQDMRTACDLYLEAAATKLGFRELPADQVQQRKLRWQQVSRWLAFGALSADRKSVGDVPTADPSWYKAPQADAPLVIQHPPTVSVLSRAEKESGVREVSKEEWYLGWWVEYGCLVTNERAGGPNPASLGCALLVSDPRFPKLPERVQGTLTGAGHPASGTPLLGVRRSGEPQALVWPVGDVPARSTILLEYRLQAEGITVKLPPAFAITALAKGPEGRVSVKASNRSGAPVQGFALTLALPVEKAVKENPTYLIGGAWKGYLQPVSHDDQGTIVFETRPSLPIDQGVSVEVRFEPGSRS